MVKKYPVSFEWPAFREMKGMRLDLKFVHEDLRHILCQT